MSYRSLEAVWENWMRNSLAPRKWVRVTGLKRELPSFFVISLVQILRNNLTNTCELTWVLEPLLRGVEGCSLIGLAHLQPVWYSIRGSQLTSRPSVRWRGSQVFLLAWIFLVCKVRVASPSVSSISRWTSLVSWTER